MDLKDTILETIQEIDTEEIVEELKDNLENKNCNKEFLEDLREKILILFAGLQSKNAENIEIKLDVTLNFLEYLLYKKKKKLSNN